jgi:hypothetical protein
LLSKNLFITLSLFIITSNIGKAEIVESKNQTASHIFWEKDNKNEFTVLKKSSKNNIGSVNNNQIRPRFISWSNDNPTPLINLNSTIMTNISADKFRKQELYKNVLSLIKESKPTALNSLRQLSAK